MMENTKPRKYSSMNGKRPIPTYVINRQYQHPNTSSSSEDGHTNQHIVQIIPPPVPAGHTRGRSADLLNIQPGFVPNRSQTSKSWKGNPRRRSLPLGVTGEPSHLHGSDQSNEQSGAARFCHSDESKHRADAIIFVPPQDSHLSSAASTAVSASCLPYQPIHDAEGHLITYKAGGCIVTISTSTRSSEYTKNIYSGNQDGAGSGPQGTREDKNDAEAMKPPKGTISLSDKTRQINLDKKTMDLRDKFEKKFNNASTFDSSFPMTSSPISQKDSAAKSEQSARPGQPSLAVKKESSINREILQEVAQPSELGTKNRRRSSSLQRSRPVHKIRRDGQIPHKHPDEENVGWDGRTKLPTRHHRTSSQDSVLTSVDMRAGIEANPIELLCDVAKDSEYLKGENVNPSTTDAKHTDDQKAKKMKTKVSDPIKLFEKGKLRDSKRSSKASKHKRTLSVPSETVLEARRSALRKSTKFEDKNLRTSKRKKKGVLSPSVIPGRICLPPQTVDVSPADQARKVEQVHSAPDTTANASSDVQGGTQRKNIPIIASTLESDLSTVASNCFNILSKLPSKQNKATKFQMKTSDAKQSNKENSVEEANKKSTDIQKSGSLDNVVSSRSSANARGDAALDADSHHKRSIDSNPEGPAAIKKAKVEYISAGESTTCPGRPVINLIQPGNANDTNVDFLNTVAGCIERLEKGISRGGPAVEAVVLQDSLFLDSSGRLHCAKNYSPMATSKEVDNVNINRMVKTTLANPASHNHSQGNTTEENERETGNDGTQPEASSLGLEHSIELPNATATENDEEHEIKTNGHPHAGSRPRRIILPGSKKATVYPRVKSSPNSGQHVIFGYAGIGSQDSLDISLPPRPASVPLSLPGEPPLLCGQDPRVLIAEAYSLSRSMNRVIDAMQQHLNYKDAALLHMEYKLREERQLRLQLEARVAHLEAMRRN